MKLVKEIVIEKKSAEVFEVQQGQRFRIIAHEGEQVGDVCFINPNNIQDQFASGLTVLANHIQSTGNYQQVKKIYSKSPDPNHMLTITEDRIGHHYLATPGGCNEFGHELLGNLPEGYDSREELPSDYPTCSKNLVNALNKFGLTEINKVPNIFNLGMNVFINENQEREYKRPEFTKGDFTEFEAEMDVVVAISACPEAMIYNMFEPKGLCVQIFE